MACVSSTFKQCTTMTERESIMEGQGAVREDGKCMKRTKKTCSLYTVCALLLLKITGIHSPLATIWQETAGITN